jgi:integrase
LNCFARARLPSRRLQWNYQAGGELEQIQSLRGHVSVQMTERYLGCRQKLHDTVMAISGWSPGLPQRRFSPPTDSHCHDIPF